MKKVTFLLLALGLFLSATQSAIAQSARPTADELLEEVEIATDSASGSAQATPSATVEPRIEKQENDITQAPNRQTDALTLFLEENPPQPLSWYNPLQYVVRQAVTNGLAPNIIVLLIMFPIIASIIAASRHVIGLQGFGVYIPAVLSVAFVSTGITTGIAIFAVVMLTATIFRAILKKLRLQSLPRTALLLWGVSLAVLMALLLTAVYGLNSLFTVTIFPLLIIILLTENFMETQLMSSQSQALELTLETLFIAVICSVIISFQPLQRWVLLNPELTFIVVAGFNFIIGKYSGLRLLEYIRFRSLLEG